MKNRLNRENRKKNNRKNRTEKKTRLNRLNFWKNRPVRFRFYKQKTKKTELNRNRQKTEPKPRKPSQNRKNRAKLVWTGFCPKKPNRTETGRFDPVSVFFFKKKYFGLVIFFDKNRTEPKIITSTLQWKYWQK